MTGFHLFHIGAYVVLSFVIGLVISYYAQRKIQKVAAEKKEARRALIKRRGPHRFEYDKKYLGV